MVSYFKSTNKNISVEEWKKSWEPFIIYLLKSNLDDFLLDLLSYLAGKSQTAPRIFFHFNTSILIYFFRYETIARRIFDTYYFNYRYPELSEEIY